MSGEYSVILFQSVNHAMWAETLLKERGIGLKLIPVPRHLSANCGVCLRILSGDAPEAEALLRDRIPFESIRPL